MGLGYPEASSRAARDTLCHPPTLLGTAQVAVSVWGGCTVREVTFIKPINIVVPVFFIVQEAVRNCSFVLVRQEETV